MQKDKHEVETRLEAGRYLKLIEFSVNWVYHQSCIIYGEILYILYSYIEYINSWRKF